MPVPPVSFLMRCFCVLCLLLLMIFCFSLRSPCGSSLSIDCTSTNGVLNFLLELASLRSSSVPSETEDFESSSSSTSIICSFLLIELTVLVDTFYDGGLFTTVFATENCVRPLISVVYWFYSCKFYSEFSSGPSSSS